MATERAHYVRDADARLATMKAAVAQVRAAARAKGLCAETRHGPAEQDSGRELDALVRGIARRLDRIKAATADSWEALKGGTESAFEELAQAVQNTGGRY